VSTTIRADCGPSVRCSATPGGVAPYWGMLGPMGNSGSDSTTALRVGSKVGLRTARSASDPSATTVHAFTTVARGVGPGRAYAAQFPSEASCRAPAMGGSSTGATAASMSRSSRTAGVISTNVAAL
jgi:hypothetical protein